MVGRPTLMRLRITLTALTVGAALAIGAPAAIAQTNSAQDGYSTPGGAVQTQLDNGNDPGNETTPPAPRTVQTAEGSSLPFTGLDVALIVGAGGMLLLLGFGLRRFSRPTQAL